MVFIDIPAELIHMNHTRLRYRRYFPGIRSQLLHIKKPIYASIKSAICSYIFASSKDIWCYYLSLPTSSKMDTFCPAYQKINFAKRKTIKFQQMKVSHLFSDCDIIHQTMRQRRQKGWRIAECCTTSKRVYVSACDGKRLKDIWNHLLNNPGQLQCFSKKRSWWMQASPHSKWLIIFQPPCVCLFSFGRGEKQSKEKESNSPQKQKFGCYWKRFVCSYCMNKPKSDLSLKNKHYLGGGEAFLDSGGGGGERPRLDTPAGLTKPY